MEYKSRSQVEREGERAFERNPYGRDRNPYREYDGYEERSRHRIWNDGFRSAERRDEERREEERRAEIRKQQRRHEVERQRQRQEDEYKEQEMEEEEKQEPDHIDFTREEENLHELQERGGK